MESKRTVGVSSMLAIAGCGLSYQAFVQTAGSSHGAPTQALRGNASQATRTNLSSASVSAAASITGLAVLGASRARGDKVRRCAEFNGADMPGATAPLGWFDPLGLGKTEERFNKMRAAELKHGRVAMMASLGCVVQHWAKFPGFESAPAGLGALSNPAALGGMGALFLGCGVLELGFWSDEAAKEPGNFGDPANFSAEYGAYSKEFRDKEINNGRMAMMAIIGQLSAEAVTGMDAAQQAGLAAVARPRQIQSSSAFVGAASIAPKRLTARRAFDASQEAGVTAPLGYFDPAGFVQDEESFLNLRRAEIKHGRVAMMAALGLLVQSLIKLPGFDSVPAGLGAQWTAPGDAGLWTVVVLCGFFETGLNQWREDPKQPGNFGDPMNLGNYTMEMRNKELNNGRIAMFAVMGIISAEIYTGNVAVAQF